MYSVSRIKQINSDGTVLVGCLTSACEGCKASLFCNNKDDNDYLVLNSSKVSVSEGDYVELYMPPVPTIMSTVLVFAFPLALFPIGYLLSKVALPASNEIVHALCGFGAMAVAFSIAALITVRNKRKLMPTITKVVSPAEQGK